MRTKISRWARVGARVLMAALSLVALAVALWLGLNLAAHHWSAGYYNNTPTMQGIGITGLVVLALGAVGGAMVALGRAGVQIACLSVFGWLVGDFFIFAFLAGEATS